MDQSPCLGFIRRLRSLNHELDEKLLEGLRPIGLSCVQADALMALNDLQPCTLKTLSENLIAESGHPSRLISRMKDRGLVKVEQSPEDGRAMLISLTTRGEYLAGQSLEVRRKIIDELKFPAHDFKETADFLSQVSTQLRG